VFSFCLWQYEGDYENDMRHGPGLFHTTHEYNATVVKTFVRRYEWGSLREEYEMFSGYASVCLISLFLSHILTLFRSCPLPLRLFAVPKNVFSSVRLSYTRWH